MGLESNSKRNNHIFWSYIILGGASLFDITYGAIAASTVLGTIPLVILVLIFQRKIVRGLTSGAVKG